MLRVLRSRALTSIHPRTGRGVLQPPDPIGPAPQTTAPPPLQEPQRPPAIPRQQISQGGCPDLRPLLLPPGGSLVASLKLGLWGRDLGGPRQARSPLPGSRGSAFTHHRPVPRRLPALLRCLRAPCSSSACCRPKTKKGA